MRSYIILCEAGDRSCHYWISIASLSLHTTQSAANACGQRDGVEGSGKKERTEEERKDKSWEGERDGEEEMEAEGADNGVKEEREPTVEGRKRKKTEIESEKETTPQPSTVFFNSM